MLKTDLHIHTNVPIKYFDSHIDPKELIDKAAKLNFDVLALTEHTGYNTIRGVKYIREPLRTYYQFRDYAKKKGILLIPGVELYIEGKDILLINFKGDPRAYRRIEDLEKLKNENTLVIAPHPYFIGKSCLHKKLVENIKIFDAIEQSQFYIQLLNFNIPARKTAERYNKPLIATSDAHFLFGFGKNYTMIDAEKNVDSLLEAIQKNKIEIITKPIGHWEFLTLAAYHAYSNILKQLL
jgi:predicted metal-dependent phosphoesterase TrpH